MDATVELERARPAGNRQSADMSTSAAKPAVVFLRHLVDGINALSDIENIRVTSTERVTGKTKDADGKPIQLPVDLQWHFKQDGSQYKVIVHCHEWSRPVSLQMVLAMKSMLAELPKSYSAVLVTMRGVEQTALQYARAQGIKICLLKPSSIGPSVNAELKPFVRFKGLVPKISNVQLHIDTAQNNLSEHHLINGGASHDLVLVAEDGRGLGTLRELCAAIVPRGVKTRVPEQRLERSFNEPVYIQLDSQGLESSRIKLKGVSAVMALEEFESGLDQIEVARQLLETVISNTSDLGLKV